MKIEEKKKIYKIIETGKSNIILKELWKPKKYISMYIRCILAVEDGRK